MRICGRRPAMHTPCRRASASAQRIAWGRDVARSIRLQRSSRTRSTLAAGASRLFRGSWRNSPRRVSYLLYAMHFGSKSAEECGCAHISAQSRARNARQRPCQAWRDALMCALGNAVTHRCLLLFGRGRTARTTSMGRKKAGVMSMAPGIPNTHITIHSLRAVTGLECFCCWGGW